MSTPHIAILGAGNIGRALARGLVDHGDLSPAQIHLTRRHLAPIDDLAAEGFPCTSDNHAAVAAAGLIILAVEPRQLAGLVSSLAPVLDPARHVLVSIVSGVPVATVREALGRTDVPLVRAMPNTAAALGESMTCLARDGLAPSRGEDDPALEAANELFERIGSTLVIDEELMTPATALTACGIAFFLRAIRAASQGGIEIGFHPTDALRLAAQTALGAASLVSNSGDHPERAIDAVTTPRGCTIAGLNEMEHRGFSSAIIRGIVTSAAKAG